MRVRALLLFLVLAAALPSGAFALEHAPTELIGPPPSWFLGTAAQVLAALGRVLGWMS